METENILGLQEKEDWVVFTPTLEDLKKNIEYPDNSVDLIDTYLVLDHLSAPNLDNTLREFHRILKEEHPLYIVIDSFNNVVGRIGVLYNNETKLSLVPFFNTQGYVERTEVKYFHTPESIQTHLKSNGFEIEELKEEVETSPTIRHLIKVIALKSSI